MAKSPTDELARQAMAHREEPWPTVATRRLLRACRELDFDQERTRIMLIWLGHAKRRAGRATPEAINPHAQLLLDKFFGGSEV